jgi:hypothetical protein
VHQEDPGPALQPLRHQRLLLVAAAQRLKLAGDALTKERIIERCYSTELAA